VMLRLIEQKGGLARIVLLFEAWPHFFAGCTTGD
jgi:hypothetical protein